MRKKKQVKNHSDNKRVVIHEPKVDFTPSPFVSQNLKQSPMNMTSAIEYLLYYKPCFRNKEETTSMLHMKPYKSMGDINKSSIYVRDFWAFLHNTSSMGDGKKIREESFDWRLSVRKSDMMNIFRKAAPVVVEPETRVGNFKVEIKETPTYFLHLFQSRGAVEGTKRADEILEQNEAYKRRVKTYKKTYNAETQTPALMLVNRPMHMNKNEKTDSQVHATYSDIYDCNDVTVDSYLSFDSANTQRTDNDPTLNQKRKPLMIVDDLEDIKSGVVEDEFAEACKIVDIIESPEFSTSCITLFRCIDRTINYPKQMIFRKSPEVIPSSNKCFITYDFQHLWTLRYLKVWGMPVTSVCINPIKANIVAAGYGMYFLEQPRHLGRVCVWNLKNCSHPEKHLDFKGGVTSISFSRTHPFALLVSLISGEVSILDISKPNIEVLISCPGDSSEPIWHVTWFTLDSKTEEPVACGDKGNVYLIPKEHFVKKVFVSLSKREGLVKGIALPTRCGKPKAVTYRPSVTCMATNAESCTDYLVGTDDGCVHICSSDFWHEHSDVFQAHLGPVHHIKYHPDCNKIFLTVGNDYCVRIWAFGLFQPISVIQEWKNHIEDADWSPVNPNIIALVSSNELSLFDISRQKVRSQNSMKCPTDSRFTSVKFTPNGANLMCGDISGDIHVYSLSNMPFEFKKKLSVLMRTVKRLVHGKKDLRDKVRSLGHPFDMIADLDLLSPHNKTSHFYSPLFCFTYFILPAHLRDFYIKIYFVLPTQH